MFILKLCPKNCWREKYLQKTIVILSENEYTIFVINKLKRIAVHVIYLNTENKQNF